MLVTNTYTDTDSKLIKFMHARCTVYTRFVP